MLFGLFWDATRLFCLTVWSRYDYYCDFRVKRPRLLDILFP
jgi:hypothetical protein